jgi:hypothetical protein
MFWARDTAERDRRRARRGEREAKFGLSVPRGKFGVIITDTDSTNTLEQVEEIYALAAKHCLMLMGCYGVTVPGALAVLKSCGFTYKSSLIQVHNTRGVFDGFAWRRETHWLLGTKGKVPAPALGTQWKSVAESDDPTLVHQFAAQFFPSVPALDLRGAA